MLAILLKLPAEQAVLQRGEWIYERKLDGLRCVAVCADGRVELWSRNRLSFSGRFPHLVNELGGLGISPMVLDGEIVAFDERDHTSFQLLQGAGPGPPAVYVVFDLIHLLGRDTTVLPLTDRADLLRRAIAVTGGGHLQVSEHLTGPPAELLRQACERGWEGLVAKRADSRYRSGRSPDWRKLKCSARQELIIGGWTEPSGSRTGFGALLVGYYRDGTLRYAGRVGTGFDEQTLRSLHSELRRREMAASPFADLARQAGTHWARPELVAEVAFSEWTRDGRLRHPRFLGLRPDKAPADVVREDPAAGPA